MGALFASSQSFPETSTSHHSSWFFSRSSSTVLAASFQALAGLHLWNTSQTPPNEPTEMHSCLMPQSATGQLRHQTEFVFPRDLHFLRCHTTRNTDECWNSNQHVRYTAKCSKDSQQLLIIGSRVNTLRALSSHSRKLKAQEPEHDQSARKFPQGLQNTLQSTAQLRSWNLLFSQ